MECIRTGLEIIKSLFQDETVLFLPTSGQVNVASVVLMFNIINQALTGFDFGIVAKDVIAATLIRLRCTTHATQFFF